MADSKPIIDEKKLRSWKLLDDFRSRLARIRAEMPPPPDKRPGGPERLLLEEDYFSLMLFGMLNPVLDTMRGLCAASHLERVQNEVCSRKVSLGSFSEAQGAFDPELLKGVFLDLVGENQTSWGDARLAHLAHLAGQAQARGRHAAARPPSHALGTLAKRSKPRRQAAFEIFGAAPRCL